MYKIRKQISFRSHKYICNMHFPYGWFKNKLLRLVRTAGWVGFWKSYVIFRLGHDECLRQITRWVGGVKKGLKHAYVLFEWSLTQQGSIYQFSFLFYILDENPAAMQREVASGVKLQKSVFLCLLSVLFASLITNVTTWSLFPIFFSFSKKIQPTPTTNKIPIGIGV